MSWLIFNLTPFFERYKTFYLKIITCRSIFNFFLVFENQIFKFFWGGGKFRRNFRRVCPLQNRLHPEHCPKVSPAGVSRRKFYRIPAEYFLRLAEFRRDISHRIFRRRAIFRRKNVLFPSEFLSQIRCIFAIHWAFPKTKHKNILSCESKLSTYIHVLLNDHCINWLGARFATHFKLKQWIRWM